MYIGGVQFIRRRLSLKTVSMEVVLGSPKLFVPVANNINVLH